MRTCLCCFLARGCALNYVAATGTCILWMLGLHGGAAASCRAFSLLVMLGLDARSFSLEGKVLVCAVVAVAPIFPPPKNPLLTSCASGETTGRSTGPCLSKLQTALATRWHYVSAKRGIDTFPAVAQAKSAGAVSESPPNRAGHRVSTGKRSTHASQGSAASAESAGAAAAAAMGGATEISSYKGSASRLRLFLRPWRLQLGLWRSF